MTEARSAPRRQYAERATSPADYCAFFRTCFGPMIALRASLADRVGDFDAEFLAFAMRTNRGAPEGPAEYPYEYLLVVARTRDE